MDLPEYHDALRNRPRAAIKNPVRDASLTGAETRGGGRKGKGNEEPADDTFRSPIKRNRQMGIGQPFTPYNSLGNSKPKQMDPTSQRHERRSEAAVKREEDTGIGAYVKVKQRGGFVPMTDFADEPRPPPARLASVTSALPKQTVPESVDLSLEDEGDHFVSPKKKTSAAPTAEDAMNKYMNATAKELMAKQEQEKEEKRHTVWPISEICSSAFGAVKTVATSTVRSFTGGLSNMGQSIIDRTPHQPKPKKKTNDPVEIVDIDSHDEDAGRRSGTSPDLLNIMFPDEPEESHPPYQCPCIDVSLLQFHEAMYFTRSDSPTAEIKRCLLTASHNELLFDCWLNEGAEELARQLTVVVQLASVRELTYGKLEDYRDLYFIDIYFTHSVLASFATIGLPLRNPEFDRMTNFRVTFEMPSGVEGVEEFLKQMHVNRQLVTKPSSKNYDSYRPVQELRLSHSHMAVPFASQNIVRNRPARNSTSQYANKITDYSFKTFPTRRTSKGPTSSGDGDDGGFLEVVQPRVPTKGELMFIYPENSPDGIHMTTIELARLQPFVYLNDNLIDFELRRMYNVLLSPSQQERTLVLNSFWYKRMSAQGAAGSKPYDRVKSWTKDVEIFKKDYIVIPINENIHWYLALIVNPKHIANAFELDNDVLTPSSPIDLFTPMGVEDVESGAEEPTQSDGPLPIVVILDSLFTNRVATMTKLKSFLVAAAEDKLSERVNPKKLRGLLAKAPKQDNTYDCGVFLLEYAEEIFKHWDRIGAELPVHGHDWFEPEQAKQRRHRMAEMMRTMATEYKERHPDLHMAVEIENSSDIEEIIIE